MRVLILGCGYTGRRVALRLAATGHEVWVTSRHPNSIQVEGARAITMPALRGLGPGLRVLHSVPLADGPSDPTPELFTLLPEDVERMVYLSTTGVYGAQHEVDEQTTPAPETPQACLRAAAEQLVLSGPWSAMVLRPAAIYGPGRGAHVAIPSGRFRLMGDGSNYVSRVHVDDLAALAAAAILSSEGGAWPVADREPAQSRTVAEFVCGLVGCPMPPSTSREELHETRRSDRRVNAGAVFHLLGVTPNYPSYREGIASALAAGLP
jgi:nucleoside-diphosphate-sugar epimerase